MTFAHLKESDNVGDRVCCPARYFFPESRVVDMRGELPPDELLVFGGGGLLYDELHEILYHSRRHAVAWGMGTNAHGQKLALHPKYLDDFLMVGLRDHGNPWREVPCPSCMHPAFDVRHQTTRDIVCVEHAARPCDLPFPKMNNAVGDDVEVSLLNLVSFIGSAEQLVAGCYHAIYWALLMGTPVSMWRPFSSRFHHLAVEVPVYTGGVPRGRTAPPGYLNECRRVNVDFASLVAELKEDK